MAKKKAAVAPLKLWKFAVNYGRMGDLDGIFVATEEEVTKAYGRRIYFGEVLGKHSEIVLEEFGADCVHVLTDDAAFIAKAEEYGILPQGFNPLSYISCPECADPLDVPYTKCPNKHCGWEADHG